MKRIAAPMVGGMVTSTVLTLVVIPVIYEMWRGWQMRHGPDGAPAPEPKPEVLPAPGEAGQ